MLRDHLSSIFYPQYVLGLDRLHRALLGQSLQRAGVLEAHAGQQADDSRAAQPPGRQVGA
jgi:hypothetical protein